MDRRSKSIVGFRKVLDRALLVLREEGFTESEIEKLLREPVDPRLTKLECPRTTAKGLEWLVQCAVGGDVIARHYVAQEVQIYLRKKIALPSLVQDYLLAAIENRDVEGLGWRGPSHRDPVKEGMKKWARAALVFFLADGDPKNEAKALRRLAEIDGKSSARKYKESCARQMEACSLWGNARWGTASIAVKACRILIEL